MMNMLRVPIVQDGIAKGWPQVKGRCPACGFQSLFLAMGGYVTCAIAKCPEPDAASKRLEE